MKKILRPKYINDTALDILRRSGVFLSADCGGLGTCGRCRIRITDSSACPEPTDAERELISDAELDEGVRLACSLRAGEMQDRAEDWESGLEVEIPAGSLIHDMPFTAGIDMEITSLKQLGPSEVIAVDYGTTVISGALVDLNLGVTGEASVINHQKAYGADVISRIRAANSGYLEELRHVSWDDLEELALKLGRDPERARYIISGNTVMGHLISGFSCKGLGEYPYTPVDVSLRRDENKTFLPGVSAFVGADVVSGICACSLDQAGEPWLYVDIGTNGEMALGTGSRIVTASAPAGPAFEGGGLSCGVPAAAGAVCGAVITGSKPFPYIIGSDPGDGAVKASPAGICGSGAIDIAAELRKNRLIDENGTLAEEFSEDGFRIADGVCVTQKDIREIQKAKAAIRAGIETLIAESGVKIEDIRKLVIAGSFGESINMDNAAGIGLIPEELLRVSGTAGNASLTGATLYALDPGFGPRLEKAASSAETVELSETPEFSARYISYMGF